MTVPYFHGMRFPYGFPTNYTRPLAGGLIWPRCINAEPGSFGHECSKPATCIGTDHETGFQACFCDDCAANGSEGRRYANLTPLPRAPIYLGAFVTIADPMNAYRGRRGKVVDSGRPGFATVHMSSDGATISTCVALDNLRVAA